MKTGEPISMHTEFEQVAPALQLLKLYKRFGEFIAVNHIDLVVPRGSFTELLGLMEQENYIFIDGRWFVTTR